MYVTDISPKALKKAHVVFQFIYNFMQRNIGHISIIKSISHCKKQLLLKVEPTLMDPIKDLYISPNRKIYSHTEIDTDSDNTRERKRERERERD